MVCVCLRVCLLIPAKMAKPIEMPFGSHLRMPNQQCQSTNAKWTQRYHLCFLYNAWIYFSSERFECLLVAKIYFDWFGYLGWTYNWHEAFCSRTVGSCKERVCGIVFVIICQCHCVLIKLLSAWTSDDDLMKKDDSVSRFMLMIVKGVYLQYCSVQMYLINMLHLCLSAWPILQII